MTDPFDLQRFVDAQARMYAIALAELEAGEKESHWMWFIFPQLRGLGRSPTAAFYGLGSLDEARAYLAHPVLGPRLVAATRAVLGVRGRSLRDIFGPVDAAKFRSSMTLFERAAPAGEGAFGDALECCCEGTADSRTLALLARTG